MKFKYRDRVKIISGFYRECAGTILDYDEIESFYFKDEVCRIYYTVQLDLGSKEIKVNEHNLESLYTL